MNKSTIHRFLLKQYNQQYTLIKYVFIKTSEKNNSYNPRSHFSHEIWAVICIIRSHPHGIIVLHCTYDTIVTQK